MAASYTLKARLNEDRTAIFDVQIIEGDQYHMGTVQVVGVDPALAAKLAERWKLSTGAVYDDSYRGRYLMNAGSLLLQPRRYEIRFIERMDDANKVVSVTLQAVQVQ